MLITAATFQGESYARPTAVGPYEHQDHARSGSWPNPSHPHIFNLSPSTLARDEVDKLDHHEALRRAQYEARRAEALRRAELEARHPTQFSGMPKHAMVPSTQSRRSMSLGNVSGLVADRTNGDRPQNRSGPILQMTPLTRDAPSHIPDTTDTSRQLAWSHGPWPYHSGPSLDIPSILNHRYLGKREDSPSPKSSDSESIPRSASHSPSNALFIRSHFPYNHYGPSSPSEHSGVPYTGLRTADLAFTPSTSPFLGPFRTLNIDSTSPSRVPSPIFLSPPGVIGGLGSDIATFEDLLPVQGPRLSSCNSPAPGKRKKPCREVASLLQPASLPRPLACYPLRINERSLPPLPAPQLSSGPSSGGSSSSLSYSSGPLPSAPAASGTLSATGSRTSSPLHWQPHHRRVSSSGGAHAHPHPHHYHIAQSVHKAFETTLPGLDSMSRPFLSMPTSRTVSPPITLAPLKIPHASSLTQVGESSGRECSRVELPGFKQFEAATRVAAL